MRALLFALIFSCSLGTHASDSVPSAVKDSLRTVRQTVTANSVFAVFDAGAHMQNGAVLVTGASTEKDAAALVIDALSKAKINAAVEIKMLPQADLTPDERWALVRIPVASLNGRDSFSASVVTQAVAGTPLRVLEKGRFWRVQTPEGYSGWVHRGQITLLSEKALSDWNASPKIVLTQNAVLESNGGARIAPLPVSSRLKLIELQGVRALAELPDGRRGTVAAGTFMTEEHFRKKWEELREDPRRFAQELAKEAGKFMGTPYVWGGTSSFGADCSGFVQALFRAADLTIPRDAHEQARAFEKTGEATPPVGALLVFGSADAIEHIAFSTGDLNFIHALGDVHAASLDPASVLYDAYEKDRYLGAVMPLSFLPDPCLAPQSGRGFYAAPPRLPEPCRLRKKW